MSKRLVSSICLPLLCMSSIAWGAHSETSHKVAFTTAVPFEFIAGNRMLPAGTYTFEMASGAPIAGDPVAVLVVRDANQHSYVAVVTSVAQTLEPRVKSTAVFQKVGDRVFLSEVWQEGKSLGLQLQQSKIETESAQSSIEPEMITLLATASARSNPTLSAAK